VPIRAVTTGSRGSDRMFLAALTVLAIASVPLAGGRLGQLAELRLRAVWALVLALLAQVVIISIVPGGDVTTHRVLHLTTYVAVLGWVVLNRRLLWRWPIVVGGVLNFVVIVANGGVMPASRAAQAAAGLSAHGGFENSAPLTDARLAFLGDIFAVPSWVPLANVFSIGDALLVLGIFLAVHRLGESYLAYLLARLGDRLRRAPSGRPPAQGSGAGSSAPMSVPDPPAPVPRHQQAIVVH